MSTAIERSGSGRLLAGVAGALLGGLIAVVWVLPFGFHPGVWLLPALGSAVGAATGDRGLRRLIRMVTLQ